MRALDKYMAIMDRVGLPLDPYIIQPVEAHLERFHGVSTKFVGRVTGYDIDGGLTVVGEFFYTVDPCEAVCAAEVLTDDT